MKESLPKRILSICIFDKDINVLNLLMNFFKNKGHAVVCSETCKKIQEILSTSKPDVLILDPHSNGVSCLQVCSSIRANPLYQDLPIIVISSRASEKDKINAFSAGIDDYLTKPLMLGELEARIQALLRRTKKESSKQILETRSIRLNRDTRSVTRHGRDITLGPLEFKLLEYFILNRGRVLSRAQLVEKIWPQDENVSDRTVDVYVLRLRRALTKESENNPFKTIRSMGYLFEDDTL